MTLPVSPEKAIINGSSGFCVGFTRETCSNAKLLGLMRVLDHEMVEQNSPGL
jgi:hypothetical protein